MTPSIPRANSGFTLVELMVAAVLLAIISLAIGRLSHSGMHAHEYARRLNRVTELNHDALDEMRLDLVSNMRLFGNDVEGNANLAVLDLSTSPAQLAGLRLPSLSAGGRLQADTPGAEITGNSLFFAKLAWTDPFTCTSGNHYLVDVYRWEYCYLSPVGTGPASGNPVGLDFVRFLSEPLADAASIDRITNAADQAEVLLHLSAATADADGKVHSPLEVVWRRGGLATAVGTLRQIDDTDGSLSDTPIGGRPNPWRVLPSEPGVRGQLASRTASVATNFAPPAFGVGRFGLVTTSGAGFPHGFEVQIVGPTSARQVLLRLVIANIIPLGRPAWSSAQAVIDCRDF